MGTMKGWETRRLKQEAREREVAEAERGRLLKLAEEMEKLWSEASLTNKTAESKAHAYGGGAALREFIRRAASA